jgi:hypothetical protein
MMMKRLSIVVPYRDREGHLALFTPHLRAYFARDKADRDIPYRVLIIEQEPGLMFNRGALKNIGFKLGQAHSDYTCFHDVDYLPIWADYSWVESPTCIVWFGAGQRPIAPGEPAMVYNNLERFFGGVVLVPNSQFAQAGGYANDFWGWGYEDSDLQIRFSRIGLRIGRRRGTFEALDHVHEGYERSGALTDAARRNHQLLLKHWSGNAALAGQASEPNGLSSLKYDVLSRQTIPDGNPERDVIWEIVKVRLRQGPQPGPRIGPQGTGAIDLG